MEYNMVLIYCQSESCDDYFFKANRKPTEKEFDEFVEKYYPHEYEDGCNFMYIREVIDLEHMETIKF